MQFYQLAQGVAGVVAAFNINMGMDSVTVPSTMDANNIETSYNTNYSMDEYYSELNQVFCDGAGLFGDWSLEQKA